MRLISAVVLVVGLLALSIWLPRDRGSVGTGDPPSLAGDSIEAPADVYDPVSEGEKTPEGFRQLLSRDAILPVYNPGFKTAAETDWEGETLVIGIAREGEAKAYPVNVLNFREMVIDWIGSTPILVSW